MKLVVMIPFLLCVLECLYRLALGGEGALVVGYFQSVVAIFAVFPDADQP